MDNLIVMKFGGDSLSTPDKIINAADIIQKTKESKKNNIIVVVSAMGKMTDDLLTLAKRISAKPSYREQDMLISAGERISMALLAMALIEKGMEAISFTGSQSGIITSEDHFDARIIDVKPYRIIDSLKESKIVIVAGFQGVSAKREVTTLGRGGSDTTAVALAAALGAKEVRFYKDVDGVYTEDPKDNPNAKRCENLTHSETLQLLLKGGKILHRRSVLLAQKNNITLKVLSYIKEGEDQLQKVLSRGKIEEQKLFCGTVISSNIAGVGKIIFEK